MLNCYITTSNTKPDPTHYYWVWIQFNVMPRTLAVHTCACSKMLQHNIMNFVLLIFSQTGFRALVTESTEDS